MPVPPPPPYLFSLAVELDKELEGEVGVGSAPGVRVLPGHLHLRVPQRLQLQVLGRVRFDCRRGKPPLLSRQALEPGFRLLILDD